MRRRTLCAAPANTLLPLMLLLAGTSVGSPAPIAAQSGPAVAEAAPDPGSAKLFIGTYKNILVIDEATSAVEGEIFLRSGIPRSMVLSADRRRFYVLNTMYETIEVVDIASRRSVDEFTLSSGRRQIRIWGYNVDPEERYAIILAKSYDRQPDRYDVSGPLLLRYDLRQRMVTDTVPWPGGLPRENARILFSPDGSLVYFFTDEILVLETKTFTEVDRWRYENALGEGIGSFEFGFPEQAFEEEGFFTGLFRVTDPVQNRRLMGVARVDLARRQVEFFTLGPNENVSFVLAPGGKRAYGLQNRVGDHRFWTFDLETQRVHSRHTFAGRPRMSLMTSSSGKVLYIYNAGHTIDLYDAESYRYLRTIDMNVDSSTGLFVIPAAAVSAGRE